mgnify:CR=1 FL=1
MELLTRNTADSRAANDIRLDESNGPMLLLAQAEALEWAAREALQQGRSALASGLYYEAARLREEAEK